MGFGYICRNANGGLKPYRSRKNNDKKVIATFRVMKAGRHFFDISLMADINHQLFNYYNRRVRKRANKILLCEF